MAVTIEIRYWIPDDSEDWDEDEEEEGEWISAGTMNLSRVPSRGEGIETPHGCLGVTAVVHQARGSLYDAIVFGRY